MTNLPAETPEMRSITVEIPTIIAQKMAESFEGTLEDATLQGLRLLHGMGIPAYTKLQALAKQREMSVPKAMRAAVDALAEAVIKGKPGAAGRPKINEARDAAIYNNVLSGHTYAEVATAFGISLVRVGQIVAQQRAMRGVVPRVDIITRNAEILRRVEAGEPRHDVATSYGVTRGVVDNIMATHRAANPKPIPEMPQVQEAQEVLSLNASEALAEDVLTPQPTEPPKPRYVMPGLKPRSTEADDGLTAIERDVFDPEFGF